MCGWRKQLLWSEDADWVASYPVPLRSCCGWERSCLWNMLRWRGRRLGTTGLAMGLLLAGAEPEELITAVVAAARPGVGSRLGSTTRHRRAGWGRWPGRTTDEVLDGVDLTAMTPLVTGASSGLGVESVRVLAAHGARLLLAVRELGKGERV